LNLAASLSQDCEAKSGTPVNREAFTYSATTRALMITLLVLSRGTLLVLAALFVFSPDPVTPSKLLRAFGLLFVVPALAAALIRRSRAAELTLEGDALCLDERGRRVEIPVASIDAVEPWRVPLPAGGWGFRLKSGKRFSESVVTPDPVRWAEALAAAGAGETARLAARHPNALYARSRHAARSRWDHPWFKYVVFSLVPTLPLWRLHQYIAYGGTFGEYYLHGLKAYVTGFALHWLLFAIYLLIYASVLRAGTEAVSLAAARIAPSREARVRRAAEILHRVLYFGGAPAFLILRLIPW
jgi:apolipoprotein N-acyltransferase